MQRGFMPALLALTAPADYLKWWEGYVATYLERDLRQMSQSVLKARNTRPTVAAVSSRHCDQ